MQRAAEAEHWFYILHIQQMTLLPWLSRVYHWQYILFAFCFRLATETAVYTLRPSQQALAYLRPAQYFLF